MDASEYQHLIHHDRSPEALDDSNDLSIRIELLDSWFLEEIEDWRDRTEYMMCNMCTRNREMATNAVSELMLFSKIWKFQNHG